MSEEDKFDMYKNIVDNYFRTATFEKAKELCARDMVQLNQRYITEAVCRNEALNRANKLQKELNNRIPKEQIKEKKDWYQEAMKYLCKNGIDLDKYERYEEVVDFCKELLGE